MTSSNEQLVPVEQIDYANAIHTMRSVSADIALFAACVAVGEKHNPNWSGIKAKAEEWVFDLRTALRTPPAVEPDEGVGLPGCPFCGATPHRGLGKKESCQMHGEPFQRYSIWCPKGHANVTAQNEAMARQEWSSRAGAPSIRAQALEEATPLRAALQAIEALGSDGEHSGDRHARCRDIARSALKGGQGV